MRWAAHGSATPATSGSTGTDHYSLAFAYDCIAWERDVWFDLNQYGWIT